MVFVNVSVQLFQLSSFFHDLIVQIFNVLIIFTRRELSWLQQQTIYLHRHLIEVNSSFWNGQNFTLSDGIKPIFVFGLIELNEMILFFEKLWKIHAYAHLHLNPLSSLTFWQLHCTTHCVMLFSDYFQNLTTVNLLH